MNYKIVFFLFLITSSLFFSSFVDKDSPKSKVELGRKLFFDPLLSANNKISCATCHKPEFGFADTSAVSVGVGSRKGKRNTPSVMNMASREIFFFDGRAKTLEEQAVFPIQDHNEMDIMIEKAILRVQENKKYITLFQQLYNETPNRTNILNAIAEFERSLESSSPFDKWMAGNENAISASAKRAHKLFIDPKNKCFECHFSPDFTGDEFRNIGLFDGKEWNDSGRYTITKNPEDIGKFKVPGLRNVAVTSPYMHNGKIKALKEAIRYYNNIYLTVSHPINEDSLVRKPLNLSEQDIEDIEQFLISLTDPRYNNLIYAKNINHRRGGQMSIPKKKTR